MSEYINRESIVDNVCEGIYCGMCSFQRHGDSMSMYCGLQDFVQSIPAADVAEVRRGRWSDISGQACLCSFCGRPQNYKQALGWRYCPMCGAIMNEVGE